jgi:hypothetical protein
LGTPGVRERLRWEERKSSFSEEKEAKRLYPFLRSAEPEAEIKWIEVFWFFFSKKNRFLDAF